MKSEFYKTVTSFFCSSVSYSNTIHSDKLNKKKKKTYIEDSKTLHLVKGSSQHQVGGEWFEIELGKISRMLVKYEVLPIPNVISVC